MSDEAAQPQRSQRPCTCHPDDNPPVPCAEKYALSECKSASSEPQRPTIAELEAVLDEKVERHIEINPDGSLRVTRPSSEPPQKWTKHAHPVGWVIKSNGNEIARFVKQFCPESEIDKVIDAHNAALAAEREKFLQMDEAHVTAEKLLAFNFPMNAQPQ